MYCQNTPLTIEWSSNDEQHVKFFPTSDEGKTSGALKSSVLFEAGLVKSYELTLKVYQDSVLLGSASVTIQAVTSGDPDLDSDTTPPILTLTPGLLADANKLQPMPESSVVIKTGSVALDIYALDAGSRLKSVKIEDTCNTVTTLMKNFDFSDTDPEYPSQMQVTWYLEIMKLATGGHSVKVTATDRANNITEQTVAFTVGRDVENQTGKPFAWISNLNSTRVEIGKLGDQVVLPEITEGLYEVKGLACHAFPALQDVEFKFELYDEAAIGYVTEDWEALNGQNPLYPDYLIQNLKVENPDLRRSNEDQIYYVGPIGLCNDANSLGYDNKSFGQLDLTGVENGTYYLLLTVRSRPKPLEDGTTFAFVYSYVYKKIKLNSPLKIGNLKFSQEDVAIDVGGVPLRVVRTYNSFQKDKNSEFGYGWSYSIANMDIQLHETRQPMRVFMGSSTMSVRVGDNYDRDVTLTLPDGRRTTFAFGLELKKAELYNGQMQYYVAKYTSPEGVSARLETLAEERLTLLNTWANQKTTSFVSGSGNYSDPGFYEFEGYRLIMEDGTSYVFRRSDAGSDFVEYGTSVAYVEPRGPLYLSEIGLPTGELINLNVDLSTGKIGQLTKDNTPKGIQHFLPDMNNPSNPWIETKAIRIDYYENSNRIKAIYAPAEQTDQYTGNDDLPTVWYEYDTHGNLWKVYKLLDKTKGMDGYEKLEYAYQDNTRTSSDHYVTAIIDPRGLQPIRYEYDAAGRLIATVDAKGNRIAISHDVTSRQEIVTDRAGNPTIYEYDKRGNVLSVTDSAGKVTRYTYDSENRFGPDRQLSVTTRVPNPDDLSQLVDAVTLYDYAYYDNDSDAPEYGRLKTQTVIDPAKNKTETAYDALGNVTKVTQYKYDAEEDVYVEVLTTRTYYERNLPYFTGTTTGADLTMVWHSISLTRYDASGRVLQSVQFKMDDSIEEQLLNSDKTPKSYSELFNNWSANASNSSVTSYTYFEYATDSGYSPDQPYSVTGPDGQTQYFWYDADNHQLASWTLWDDTATGANPDKRILTYNQTDVQGRTIATYRVVQDLTAAGTPMDVAVLLAHLNEQQAGVETVALSYSDYNSIGKVNTSIDENGILTQYHYDETGNLAETLVYSSFAAYQANYTNYLTTGNTTGILTISRTFYDTEGRAIVAVGPYDPADTEHSPVGTETVYDDLGRVEQTRRWADVDILFDYVMKSGENTLENILLYVTLAQDRVAGGAWTSTPGQTQLAWTSGGKVPVITANLAWWQAGPLSYSRTEYDAAGRVWKSYSLNESNAEICTAEYRYDTAGRQIRTITLPDDTAGKRSETVTVYDGTRRLSVTDGLEHTTSFDYDALGRVITTIHPSSLVEGSGTTPVETYSHVGHDSLGRKWWEAEQTTIESYIGPGDPDFDRNNPDHVALYKSVNTKEFEYDFAGRLIAVVLPLVEINDPTTPGADSIWVYPRYEYVYDAYGNQSIIRENLYQLKRSWESTFDPATDIVSTYSRQTVFGYDGLHRQISRTVPGCGTEYKGYDSHNRLQWEMDFKEQVTGYAYDALGRLEYKRYYAADATPGDFQNTNYPSTPAEVLHYTYDNLGRKLTETVTDCAGTPTVTYDASYSYDDEGNVTAIVTPQGTVNYDYHLTTGRKSFTRRGSELATEYGYDELGRLKTTRAMVRNGQLLSPTELTTYDYDLVGNRKSATLPNGVYTEYSYNSLNRLTELVHYQTTGKTTVVGSYSYQLNATGMRMGAGEFLAYPSGSQSPVVEYDYDGLNRLVGESNKHDGTTGFEAGYVYDLVGNRLERTVIAPNGTLDTTYDYYPGTDRLYHEYQAGPVAAIPLGQNETVYAYHSPSGGLSYQMPREAGRIGALTAFLYGMPSVWGVVLLVSLLVCLPVAGLWPVLVRILRGQEVGPRPSLSLYHRCLCVLLAYTFLIGPECVVYLSQAATQYSQISTLAWGRGNSIITYGYDANGSLTSKTTTRGGQTAETVVYTYNLQNRLVRVETTPYTGGVAGAVTAVDYAYNPDGIRVGKTEMTPAGTTATAYLIDPANPTGYAQVLEETTTRYDAADVLLSVERTDYVIGEDVISQTKSNCDLETSVWTASATQYLLYDGHGSTRQLMNANLSVQDSYSYDGYGVMLGSAAGSANAAQTNLLYCGEQYDSALSQYYLRARYYNPANGLFNQLDPYAGNMQDPQSLHKYLYCHANPVNGIDPSGEFGDFSLVGSLAVMAIMMVIMSPSIVNAPTPNSITITDNGNGFMEDGYYTIAAGVLIQIFIVPVARYAFKYIGRKLHRVTIKAPDVGPGNWVSVNENMSLRAAQYQSRITGQPTNMGYVVNGVKFDGYKNGILLDAKGLGYKNFVENGRFSEWFTGKQALLDQANRQITAARGTTIEWHIAEKEAIPAFEELLKGANTEAIKVIYTP
ncbi:MAG: Tox-REase-5 domain-containing protein [Anaerohalosphaeraceae bacterium]